MSCFVYHICRIQDKGDLSKGYVGVSVNPTYRWNRHKKYEKQDSPLRRAYRKYSDIIEYIVLESNEEYCYDFESKVRNQDHQGWNIVPGGYKPPNRRGIPQSEDHKSKIGIANSGSRSAMWKGYWIVNGERFITLKEVSMKYSCTTKTVHNRAFSSKFPEWSFIERDDVERI